MPPADNTDLLALTCAADGGLTRRQATSRIHADVAINGALWASKGGTRRCWPTRISAPTPTGELLLAAQGVLSGHPTARVVVEAFV